MTVPFGLWLKIQISDRGWKQSEFAARLQISETAVSRWINKGTRPETEQCEAIARELRVDYLEVLARAGYPMPEVAPPPHSELSVSDQLVSESRRLLAAARKVAELEASYQTRGAVRLPLAGTGAAQPARGHPLPDEEPDGTYFDLNVMGDCLEPDIRPGDKLEMSAARQARAGDVVSVLIEGERHIKRVVEREGRLLLESRYGPLLVASEAQIEGVMVDGPFRK